MSYNPGKCSTCPTSQPKTNCPTKCCVSTARTCHFVVDTLAEAQQYKNAYVTIRDMGNAVVHTDDLGISVTVNQPPIREENHTAVAGAYTNSVVIDNVLNQITYYDSEGDFVTVAGV